MNKDSVLNRNFADMFRTDVRFEIPFFQRGYAWEQRQWKKLFEDLEGIIEHVENGDFQDEEHFFGPVVVLEKRSEHPSLKRYLVIDGQQRITTVYLLLAIIRRILESKAHLSGEAQGYIAQLDKMLKNDVTTDDDYFRIKVFSTKGDRLPTYKSVFGKNPVSKFLNNDMALYDPESNKIDAFLKFAAKRMARMDVSQLWEIEKAITQSLMIVWIPLDEDKDDAQAIFESLNDAGMPLSASELLCNYIFRPLTNEVSQEHEKLHNEKWLAARSSVGETSFEDYLRNLFSIGERKRVGKDRKMYVHFKIKNKKLSAEGARAVLDQILDYANVYNQISRPLLHPHPDADVKRLLMAIGETNMTSSFHFIMGLLKAHEHGSLDTTELKALLRETYILLVRRKITGLPVTKYDVFFPPLLDRIISEGDRVRAFHDIIKAEQLWVDDQTFGDAFPIRPLYNATELNFTRHVLQELDKAMQPFGEVPDYSRIDTVEHILPQTPDAHWKSYLGSDASHYNLPTITNTIGNLSLNSRQANSTFGRKSFTDKQALYTDISALSRLIKAYSGSWNIDAIENRSRELAAQAVKIWRWI